MSQVRMSLVVLLACAACSAGELPTSGAVLLDAAGLQQQVSISTATIAVGDSITVRSVVRNTGMRPDTIEIGEVGGCGLHGLAVSGIAFSARPDTAMCAGLIATVALAPGDSVLAEAVTPPITASPGEYVLTIQQVRRPLVAARVRVRVVPRPAT